CSSPSSKMLLLLTVRVSDAQSLYQRALPIWEKAVGSDYPYVATSLNNLAELYRMQGRYSEAEPALQALAGDQPKNARSRSSPRRYISEQPGAGLGQSGPLCGRS